MKHFFSLWRGWPVTGLLLILLLLFGPVARAQAPAWQMAIAVSQASAGVGSSTRATATDASGNVYIAGEFTGTIGFGNIPLTCTGVRDVFVAKWSPASNRFVWAQRAGGAGSTSATALAVSGSSVYVSGFFNGSTASFGPATLTNSAPGNTGFDVFVAKLSDAGSSSSFVWAQAGGSSAYDDTYALAVNGSSIYLAGSFKGATAHFGPLALSNTNSGGNVSDAFLVKLTDAGSTGRFVWAQQASSAGSDMTIQALAVSGPTVYLTGNFQGPTASLGSLTLGRAGAITIFAAKLTDAGASSSFEWAQRAGGTGVSFCNALAVSGNNLYLAGDFYGATATFGGTTLTNTSPATNDIFVAKITDVGTAGTIMWAQQAGGSTKDGATAIAVNGPNVYVAGIFNSPSATFGNTIITNASSSGGMFDTDIFITKLTDAGTSSSFAWAQRAGGTGMFDDAYAIAIAGSSIYVGGNVTTPANFGSLTVTSPNVNTLAFLASLTDPTLTATAATHSSLSFALAPNPANASTSVTLPAVPGAATATLTLRDALGRTLRTETLPLPPAGLRHELGLAGLAPGIYALQVRAGTATATRRLVVD